MQISHTKLESEATTPSHEYHEYASPPLTPSVVCQPAIQQTTEVPIQTTTLSNQTQMQQKSELVKHDSLPDSHRLRIATRNKIGDGSWDEDSAISQTSSTSGYRLQIY